MELKQTILNWCARQVIHNLRNVQPKQLKELKAKLEKFNASKVAWDSPNKPKITATDKPA